MAQKEMTALVECVQNNLVHAYWLDKYGVSKPFAQRFAQMQLRSAEEILSALAGEQAGGALQDKPAAKRVVGLCRDYALLVCMLLRAQAIPARLRCGFADYLRANKWEDHWICEYWHSEEKRWIKLDAQLDTVHQQILQFDFNPLDVPSKRFVTAGEMWQAFRRGDIDAKRCGIMQFRGAPYIKANVIRDLFALSCIELLAWDCGWGIIAQPMQPVNDQEEWLLLDELAQVSAISDGVKAYHYTQCHNAVRLPKGWQWSQAPTIAQLFDRAAEELY
ncbi:transglutaminase-like domain-containing protein [Vibrio navarrensis]|uniref:transglutaminase-like domain-containing protein n=1 Tax=Vibrio navarrensis TaxID=29495 RepID=UPI0029C02A3F|nr:transglutaminase-like domain-containing protein [Vibrio navarrensis]